ncbi:MAG: ferrous iron transport protein B [Ignavibacteriales bacterium]|nr:ferrous iron transport protein B [Ignavibacteriales bacterium]
MTEFNSTLPVVTLVGPPNSGKTTLLNLLSGKNYKTVNYPGSTVEYNATYFQKQFNINATLLDSPGIISLIPNSPDEQVTIDALYNHPKFGIPDLIIATVDASQLSRHLLLVDQLIRSHFRLIVVVTMVDILNRKGYEISIQNLKKELKCDVVEVDGRHGNGINNLVQNISTILKKEKQELSEKPIRIDENGDSQILLNNYKKIEEIEKSVINPKLNQTDLEKANKSLNVLNSFSRNKPDNLTLKLDGIFLHKYLGILIFFILMGLVFTSIFYLALPLMEFVDESFASLANFAIEKIGYTWIGDLVADGIISSLGAVLVFVPQIVILFLILGFLEDTGYLARGAMLIDRPLSKIGLNGRSFVPMLSGYACAIPAILAARTMSNRRERLLTIFIIPLMSCSARLPVYALLIAFLLPLEKAWIGGIVLSLIYLFSMISSVVIAALINKFRKSIIREEDNSSFILELPSYKLPRIKSVIRNSYSSTKQYLKEAGPVIIVFSFILWGLTYFPNTNPKIEDTNLTQVEYYEAQKVERISTSYASYIGKKIEPIMAPLGMDWRIGVSLISAFVAREVFVSALAVIFKVSGDEETIQQSLLNSMRNAKIEGTDQKLFTPATILGLIIFFVFAMQCLSTIAVAKKETGSWRIPIFQIIIFSGLAYISTFITVNGLRLLGIE